jgi:hypothetical protein
MSFPDFDLRCRTGDIIMFMSRAPYIYLYYDNHVTWCHCILNVDNNLIEYTATLSHYFWTKDFTV